MAFAVVSGLSVPVLAQQIGNIPLSATVTPNCTIVVTPTGAASALDLSAGAKQVAIGNILQNCNKKIGYRITVGSDNCATGTAGAKLIGALASPENLRYTLVFTNPSTGGSQTLVSGLLSTACSGDDSFILGREVSSAKIINENSTVFADYVGDDGLAADTYTDVVRLTMTVK